MATKKKMLQAAAGGGEPEGAWDLSYAYPNDPSQWSVSTARYTGVSYSVAVQESSPNGVFFKPDGTKMFVVGQTGDDVNQYNLSTAWDVSTAVYGGRESVSTEDSTPSDLFFKPDGTKMYVLGASSDNVNEYDLTTAWDVTTASYLQQFSVSSQDLSPQGLFFRSDGIKMYVLGNDNDNVYEYDLTTAWDVTTASYLQSFSVSSQETSPLGLSFKSDGTKMYMVGSGGDDVDEYDLSTAWDVSTASYLQQFSIGGQETIPTGIYFKEDGAVFYVIGKGTDTVYQYAVGGFSVSAQETSPQAVAFKPDGTKMYVAGVNGDDVNQYNLGTAWDVSTASYLQNFSVSTQETAPQGLFFKPDGTKMYVLGSSSDAVNEYDLSTAWAVWTASYLQQFSISAQEVTPSSVYFREDGAKMYIMGRAGDDVNEYDLSTAWDVSTASFVQNFSVSSQDTSPYGLFFKPDGTKMYMVGAGNHNVNEYDLSTDWDISTASFVQDFYVELSNPAPTGLFFKPDGTQMFTTDASSDRIFTYSLGVQ